MSKRLLPLLRFVSQYYAVLGDNMIFDENTKILITSQIGDFEILNDHRRDSARTGVVEVLTIISVKR